ncbi:hypothetical protein FACS189487_06980 [Campylobacterota bacterium]|nr:hypothetical protein FACS189487_06980 [Campylobacterota bacterium]
MQADFDYYDRIAARSIYPRSWADFIKSTADDVAWAELKKDYSLATPQYGKTKIVYMLGGQPGAGKSSAEDKTMALLNENALFISMDDYRKYHSLYNEIIEKHGKEASRYTHLFAGEIADIIVEKAIKYRYNFILEGTLKSYNNAAKHISHFKQNEYEVNMIVVTCPTIISRLGNVERFERNLGSRYVPTDIHSDTVRLLPSSVQNIYDNFKNDIKEFVIQNRYETLWEKGKDELPSKIIENELSRCPTEKELSFITDSFHRFNEKTRRQIISLLNDEAKRFINDKPSHDFLQSVVSNLSK